jgi:effector-binding domain-containing protein
MNISIVDQKAELALAYKEHATMENLMAVVDKGYTAVLNHLAKIGKQPVGAPYLAYFNCAEDFSEFDLEMGYPVAEDVPVENELYMSKTYEGKGVTATHKGSYSTLDDTYTAMMKFIEENSLELTGFYYDYYLNDPADTPESELLTKVVIPIK